MYDDLLISDILHYLEEEQYDYHFHGNKEEQVGGYSTLFNYKTNTMTFVSTLNKFKDYRQLFSEQQIQLILCGYEENDIQCANNIIKTEYPKKTFFDILNKFYGDPSVSSNLIEASNDNEHSFISNKAQIGKNVKIGYGCVIENGVIIGNNTVIHHNVIIRQGTNIGANCTILSGTVIGETGFNPLKQMDGSRDIIKHYGGVTIKDNVHLGDNCSISKGSIEDTVISKGVKLNKQVIIAHNVLVGEHTVFTAPTFVCGSVIIGDNCHIAATTIRNQCSIGDSAVLGLGSVVVKDVPAGETVVGNPAKPLIK